MFKSILVIIGFVMIISPAFAACGDGESRVVVVITPETTPTATIAPATPTPEEESGYFIPCTVNEYIPWQTNEIIFDPAIQVPDVVIHSLSVEVCVQGGQANVYEGGPFFAFMDVFHSLLQERFAKKYTYESERALREDICADMKEAVRQSEFLGVFYMESVFYTTGTIPVYPVGVSPTPTPSPEPYVPCIWEIIGPVA